VELSEVQKQAYQAGAKALKGTHRRQFMARIVASLGYGGQSQAERELGWNRKTIRKGQQEIERGEPITDNFGARGRQSVEKRLPQLLADIEAIASEQSQTDPTFRTTRLYTRITAAEMRRQLIAQKGYAEATLPSVESIRVRMNRLGFRLRQVQKSRPQKNS
jgi:hypothetical protein